MHSKKRRRRSHTGSINKMKEINLNHICKIEGHAHLNLKIEKNKVIECHLKAAEGARFFEALTLGKKLPDVQEVVSRICGICSVAHSVAAVVALEKAIGAKTSREQMIIRELLMIGERIRSYATHLYLLVLPDYLGFASAIEMQKKYPNEVNDALALITIGNKIIEALGGREMHPFLGIHEGVRKDFDFKEIIEYIERSKPIAKKTAKLFLSLKYPELDREMEGLSLRDEGYATIKGELVSHSEKIRTSDYKKHLSENIKEYATSMFSNLSTPILAFFNCVKTVVTKFSDKSFGVSCSWYVFANTLLSSAIIIPLINKLL